MRQRKLRCGRHLLQGERDGFWEECQRSNEKKGREIGEFDIPQVYARLGKKEKALEWLERDYGERRALATLLNVDPAFDSLHADPQFQELVRRMGLTANANGQ